MLWLQATPCYTPCKIEPTQKRWDGDIGADYSVEVKSNPKQTHPFTNAMNSARVCGCSKEPRTAEVTMIEFCFSTPRAVMQKC